MTRPAVFVSEWMVNQHLSLDEFATLSLSQSAKTKENNFHKTYIASCKSNMHMHEHVNFLLKLWIVSSPPCLFNKGWSLHLSIWHVGYVGSYMSRNYKVLNSIYTNFPQCYKWMMLTCIQVNQSYIILTNFHEIQKPGCYPDMTIPLPTSRITQTIPVLFGHWRWSYLSNLAVERSPPQILLGG